MIGSNTDLWRPATAFLSYAREDTEDVKYLQQQLNVRGMQAWRDVTDLALGSYSQDEITHAIEQESDAFLLYITPQSLKSRFIWDIEVPSALRRWEQNRAFNIVPVLRGITFTELRQFCADRGFPPLTDFNGVSIPEYSTGDAAGVNEALKIVAERALRATFNLRLRRVGADRNYEPRICFRNFPYVPPGDRLDLDLNWTELFNEWPTNKEWQEILLPALRNVKDVLSASIPSRTLHLIVQARLPAALALGFTFPDVAHFTLVLEGKHGTWSTTTIASDSSPLRSSNYGGDGDVQAAVVEIAISRDTAATVARSLPSLGLSFGHRIRFTPLGGPNDQAVRDAAHAIAMARQIGQELKRLCDREGVSHVHLFPALPAELAVLLGHQLNASSAITLYSLDAEGIYKPACTLGSFRK